MLENGTALWIAADMQKNLRMLHQIAGVSACSIHSVYLFPAKKNLNNRLPKKCNSVEIKSCM